MTKKKQYPDGVKLTAKTARTLAMQEFGTARGLTKSTSLSGGRYIPLHRRATDSIYAREEVKENQGNRAEAKEPE